MCLIAGLHPCIFKSATVCLIYFFLLVDMEIIVSQTESTGSDGRRRAPGLLPGLTLRPPHHFIIIFFSPLASSSPPPPSNCPEECLFSGIRAQARQCVSFSKGMGDWQGHDLLYFLGPFVIPRRGRGHGELPWRRSALSSSQPSLASTETFLLFFFFFLPRPPSALRSRIPDGVTHSLQLC